MTLEELKKAKEELKNIMFCQENSDDFYYTNGKRDKHLEELKNINETIEELENNGRS